MSKRCYIVSSPGRTGSKMAQCLIGSTGSKSFHTHDPFFKLPSDYNASNSTLVFVKRRDLFSAIMSSCVGKRTNEYENYSNKQITPFILPCHGSESEFVYQYEWHKWYFNSCKNTEIFGEVKTLFFEDFVNNPTHVFDVLGITAPNVIPDLNFKSPYSYSKLVINIDECKNVFDQLEKNAKFKMITKPYDPTIKI